MPPKPDPEEKKFLYMKVVGGEVTSAAALAPKCGPIGLPPKKVGEDIQKATTKWKGVKIEIEITVQNRQCTVKVLPSAAPLLIEALKEGGRDRKKVKNVNHNGNVKFDDIIKIAKTMREANKSMAIALEGTVKEILGTAVSLGCTVDGKSPKEITQSIVDGEIKCN
uniref:60S ribosomal protein L12 n=1 Tax=Strombidium rassoulzadegani TaxID=1082188 RepID=A0A7S3CQ86_9SPIT|mmetsp:Transcript_2875/g.4901  ORF Transcript_2875/g.4901 Transcript_2875/m.4901 type:complete len:166 (+) Transcript_2875:40-537(+)|eukprot:CAMPEP_0168607378 /NCGR_PEP_ID=MMETSP0449_2-20121227/3_1 /TAXON_ID=1082188 /ORGANISM="Strombidium rassoulzadegani, Strain ras09" /LENGTH=165 /DNA_ID=CAMNT_0008647175 /DNA_START=633 /DNA_END=1130 /DNA_ORIENTATION=+